jgi:hypothetical protein
MAARLGQVLYWTGCGLAVLVLSIGAWAYFGMCRGDNCLYPYVAFVALPVAGVSWLVGLAARYILAGK